MHCVCRSTDTNQMLECLLHVCLSPGSMERHLPIYLHLRYAHRSNRMIECRVEVSHATTAQGGLFNLRRKGESRKNGTEILGARLFSPPLCAVCGILKLHNQDGQCSQKVGKHARPILAARSSYCTPTSSDEAVWPFVWHAPLPASNPRMTCSQKILVASVMHDKTSCLTDLHRVAACHRWRFALRGWLCLTGVVSSHGLKKKHALLKKVT